MIDDKTGSIEREFDDELTDEALDRGDKPSACHNFCKSLSSPRDDDSR